MTRGRDRQLVRQAWILVGRNDPLTGNIDSWFEHISRVQVAEVLRLAIDLLIRGRFHCHNTALSRNVLQGEYGNLDTGVGLGGDGVRGRRFGGPAAGSLRRKRLPEIQGQCQVARNRPVQDNLPEV